VLAASCAGYDEHDASNQSDTAEDGRDGDGFVLAMRDVHRAEIGILMTLRVVKAAEDESGDTDYDQKNSDKSGCFQGDVVSPFGGISASDPLPSDA
jgi:hypothetical protein